ncbi:hypothetical protein L6R49_13405 [Myxococcota bacterium]|nr:hypothetical protein [Myxococcota bacterium]
MRSALIALCAVIALAALAPLALAQGRRITITEDDKIVGEIQRPDVPMIILRSNLNQDYDLVLRESFLPKIIESVDQRPF